MVTRRSLANAVQKAGDIGPELLKLCEGFWVAPSMSVPNKGYMLEVNNRHIHCECPGFEHHGFCYHAAALASQLGYPAFDALSNEDQQAIRETAKLVDSVPKGRKHLFD